jgi:hypothetical protein
MSEQKEVVVGEKKKRDSRRPFEVKDSSIQVKKREKITTKSLKREKREGKKKILPTWTAG